MLVLIIGLELKAVNLFLKEIPCRELDRPVFWSSGIMVKYVAAFCKVSCIFQVRYADGGCGRCGGGNLWLKRLLPDKK
jgi:hypothetical protein